MQDPCGYTPEHEWYITHEELKADPYLRAKVRDTHAKKLAMQAERVGKIQVAIIAIIGTLITAFIVRHIEYKYNDRYFKIDPEKVIDMQLKIDNIQRQVIELVRSNKGDYDITYATHKYVSELHQSEFPERHRNVFQRK